MLSILHNYQENVAVINVLLHWLDPSLCLTPSDPTFTSSINRNFIPLKYINDECKPLR